ncbi:MAG TPA: 3-hydroxyacyl-CoA dehydrogenase NAD-binding domain-containing protein [Phenylobacterium sp.]|uniref:3-hydroxyacyl-CoA dehydrogenase NAD-binding domain-containing protein n=1 Tax=Phenylobacterium sp. TaxID=1871053 RepID=UPI002B4A7C84|nr:3-hydroxyacyl-CoA dehydrogenase NAD-binding domain-containing protein [Phenylobacterium sp.]HKR86851.1 3-hydroxyacyl-CoA dehydrogenase NAD-binding domain-containing protein [Phenylobacterium sp.]
MQITMEDHIAVVGAGAMGRGIAQVAACAGHPVTVIDLEPAALARAQAALDAALADLTQKGRIAEAEARAISGRIRWSDSLSAAAGSALVIEAIVERLEVKRAVFAELGAHVGRETVLASNTSSLSISQLAAAVPAPERFLGLHFFNPAPAMKLVEVIAGEATSPAVATAASTLMRAWGKHPVAVADLPGFIVNRVARPFYAEAFVALEEGLAPALIDAALKSAGGFRMGPLTLADFIGHDVNYAAASTVFEGLQPNVRFRPQPFQARLVEQGLLGRKTGAGVYDSRVEQAPAAVIEGLAGADIRLPEDLSDLGVLAEAPGRREPALPAGVIAVDGVLAAVGDGRPLSQRPGVDILIDHVRSLAAAPILVMTVRQPSDEPAAARLAGALGKQLLLVPDRPGQIVLRTLAQIANGAVDALRDGVADAAGIDEAMLFGANYPEGPLAWARRIGPRFLEQTLANIAEATGDALYAPSAGWASL